MVVKDWAKLTPKEADEKLLSIINEHNGDIFDIFCIADGETREDIITGVKSKEYAIEAGKMCDFDFASYINEDISRKMVNMLFTEQHEKVANWLSKGARGPISLVKETNEPVGVRYLRDGSEEVVTIAGVVLHRDLSFNPDGYGFLAYPTVV